MNGTALALLLTLSLADGGGAAAAADLEAGRRFWAFQPVGDPAPPEIRGAERARGAIDRFILAALEDAGLQPAREASPRALARRLHFDLIGLPPEPEELECFLADASPDAWERRIDRLLASPRYGERWGRHWLDVARYADSNGVDENLAYSNAFRYRDYVIDAFNADLSFDRFVEEQLAGDLLPAEPGEDAEAARRRLLATGFLSVGPKMLACDDGRKMELDIVDEQLDTASRAFMGLTLGCARCHDHKYDPFTSADYYGLAGIFKSTKTMENFKVVAEWHEHEVAGAAERAARDAIDARIRETESRRRRRFEEATAEFLARERARAAAYWGAAGEAIRRGIADDADGKVSIGALAAERGLEEVFLRSWVDYLRSDAPPARALAAEAPEDGDGAAGAARPAPDGLAAAVADPKGPFRAPESPERFHSPAARADLEALAKEKAEIEKSRPELARAMGVREGKVEDLAVHIRGDYQALGERVPRRFPRVFAAIAPPSIPEGASGRLELARWLTSPAHPLTSRVIANRIWLWHFGEGLVRSPDNFGALGEPPTHPALLDWLARRLMESRWSVKDLHRRMLSSAAYRMGGAYDARAAARDPENRLRWRAAPRRLEAEAIRDALLWLSGDLDLAMHGQLLADKNRAYVYASGAKESTYDSKRRSVYLPILRSAVYQVFQTFDFPDPSVINGQRASTTVAPQALFWMNGKLVLESASRWAERLLARGGAAADRAGDAERIERAYLEAYGRAPSPEEEERCRAFLDRAQAALAEEGADEAERRPGAWQSLCRALLAASEFSHLE